MVENTMLSDEQEITEAMARVARIVGIQLVYGETKETIVQELVKEGLDGESATQLVNQIAKEISQAKAHKQSFWIGVCAILFGAVVFLLAVSSGSIEGYGAATLIVLCGALSLIKGWPRKGKNITGTGEHKEKNDLAMTFDPLANPQYLELTIDLLAQGKEKADIVAKLVRKFGRRKRSVQPFEAARQFVDLIASAIDLSEVKQKKREVYTWFFWIGIGGIVIGLSIVMEFDNYRGILLMLAGTYSAISAFFNRKKYK